MDRRFACLALLTVVCGLGADEPKPTPPAPRVVVTGKSVGLMLMKETTGKETKTLQVTLLELADHSKLAVALPPEPPQARKEGGADPDLERLLRQATQTPEMVVQGRLSSTSNTTVLAVVGAKDAKTIPLLIADRVTELTATNRKDFPPLNAARVEGVLVRAPTKLGPLTTDWALGQDAPAQIPLLLAPGAPTPVAGGKVRVTGPVRVVHGRFVVQVKEMDAIK